MGTRENLICLHVSGIKYWHCVVFFLRSAVLHSKSDKREADPFAVLELKTGAIYTCMQCMSWRYCLRFALIFKQIMYQWKEVKRCIVQGPDSAFMTMPFWCHISWLCSKWSDLLLKGWTFYISSIFTSGQAAAFVRQYQSRQVTWHHEIYPAFKNNEPAYFFAYYHRVHWCWKSFRRQLLWCFITFFPFLEKCKKRTATTSFRWE